MKSFFAVYVVAFAHVLSHVHAQVTLPTVDLGYEVHQALTYNNVSDSYSFTNIRFAQSPVGDLRFAAPVAPSGRNTTVNNGNGTIVCPQSLPSWILVGQQFTTAFAAGNESTFNFSAALNTAEAEQSAGILGLLDSGSSEDCLFLDVFVPKQVFDNAQNMRRKRASSGAPVIVWIYGGGYTEGSKTSSGTFNGLINSSKTNGGQGAIFVAMNYRLGALGWLSGPTFQSEGGISNAGLYDQRLAIEWVAQNIHLFGGDPNQITLIGESAGGGSIMHQITAYGGLKGVSFQRAIPQSPGFLPIPGQIVQENTTQAYLSLLGVSSIAEARSLSSEAVIKAQITQITNSPYGQFTYGPVVDGVFVPALPGISFLNGAYAKNVTVMAGHNINEGVLFTPPYIQNEAMLRLFLTGLVGPQTAAIDYVLNVLYPPVYNGTYPYTSVLQRASFITTESVFTCNTNFLARAFQNQTYNYEFQVPPSTHGQDVAYTFYDGTTAGVNAGVAKTLQGYITNFGLTGSPSGPNVPYFPIQGTNMSLNALNITGVTIEQDRTANARCQWWQKALYY